MCFYRGPDCVLPRMQKGSCRPQGGPQEGSYPGLIGASNPYTCSSASLLERHLSLSQGDVAGQWLLPFVQDGLFKLKCVWL